MKKIQVALLIGAALDWAVAKAQGHIDDANSWLHGATVADVEASDSWHPSTKWDQGGPLLERHRIGVVHAPDPDGEFFRWKAVDAEVEPTYGDTPLEAGMRFYVQRVLGLEIELPADYMPNAESSADAQAA